MGLLDELLLDGLFGGLGPSSTVVAVREPEERPVASLAVSTNVAALVITIASVTVG